MIKYNNKWKPVNEAGVFTDKDFDERFEIDRSYFYNTFIFKYRIRIVKYPNLGINNYKLFIIRITKFHLYFHLREKYFSSKYVITNKILKKLEKYFAKDWSYIISTYELKTLYNYKLYTIKDIRKEKIDKLLL